MTDFCSILPLQRPLTVALGLPLGALSGPLVALGVPLGHSCRVLRALGTFLGPPDRHDESTCRLIDFYGDLGAVLGGYLEPLGSPLGGPWGFLVPLGRFLAASGASLGSFLRLINDFNIQFVALCILFEEVPILSSWSTKIQHQEASGGLLSASWSLLGAYWRLLGSFWSVLEACWRPLGKHIDPFEALKAKRNIFHLCFKGLAGHLGRGNRQRISELEPWRGGKGEA